MPSGRMLWVLGEQLVNNVIGIEPSGREERTEKLWVKFPASPFIGFIITDDSTSKHLSELSVFSVAYLPCTIFGKIK